MGYRYSRYRPSSTRMAGDELPDHKFAYNCRIDAAATPAHRRRFKAECTCGWKDDGTGDRWLVNKRHAHAQWEKHRNEAARQQRLPV